jgi:hypothetical protein
MRAKNRTGQSKYAESRTKTYPMNQLHNISRDTKHPPKVENILKEQQGIHQKNTRKGKVELIYGNGCSDWRNCFTCPKEECTFSETTENDRRLTYQAIVNELIKELKQARRSFQ